MNTQNPEPSGGKAPPKRKGAEILDPQSARRNLLLWILLLTFVLLGLNAFVKGQERFEIVPYNPDFVEWVQSGRVESCQIVREPTGVEYVKGVLKPETETPGVERRRFKVYITQADGEFRQFLLTHGVRFAVPPQNPYVWQLLSSVLPVVLVFGLLYFLFMRQIRAAGHGALSFGKSRARMLSRDTHKVTFANVAGIDEAKEEVQEIIEFLRDPRRFQTLGGRIPKGVLLMGPPGTGKTLLAKAIAGEANVPFFSISGSDFVEMFVGVGASRVRDMFEQGKRNAPCIIFIDEIDAVGRSRFTGIGGGHDEREQTLNALLVEMDGFETQQGVIIVAATNRPDVLDPALLRPGRFDRQIVIDLPTLDGREAILKMHAGKIRLGAGVGVRRVARGTPGFSGADLENLLNEAALLAARQGKDAVGDADLDEARDKVKWGRERRSRVLDDKEKRITAYHEAGHALVMRLLEDSEPLHKITIIPRGAAYLGATLQLPLRDRYMESRLRLTGILTGFMGGRVAEEIAFGDVTTGAASDLKEATRIARLMVCNWGMSERMGPQTFGENQEIMFLGREVSRAQTFSERTARRIDEEVARLLQEAHDRARDILTAHRERLEQIATLLLERETLDGQDLDDLIQHGRILTPDERAAAETGGKPEGNLPAEGPQPAHEDSAGQAKTGTTNNRAP